MKKAVCLLLLCCIACRQREANINLSVKKQVVTLSGLSITTLHGLQRDSMPIAVWQNLFPVYAMPADTDLRNYQPPLPGTYRLTDSTIIFNPDTPFIAGKTYFARFYRYDKPITPANLLLHSRTPGRGTCIELIFKY